MKPSHVLFILASNRELIQQNNRHCVETLLVIEKLYRTSLNEECLLSLELNLSMVKFYFSSEYKEAISNSEKILEKFPNSIYYKFVGWHLWLIGHCYACLGMFAKAEQTLFQSLSLNTNAIEADNRLQHEIFHSLAMNNHLRKATPDKTLEYLEKALSSVIKTDDTIRQANCLLGMGNVYLELNKYTEAQIKYYAAADIYERKLDWQNMACAYCNLGLCSIQLQNFNLAETLLLRALEIQQRSSSPEHLCNTYFNLSLLYMEKEQIKPASSYLILAKNIAAETGNQPALKEILQLERQLHATYNNEIEKSHPTIREK